VIIDYLQLMTSGTTVDSRVQEVSQISRSLKVLARDLEIPIIALSQLSRAVEQRHDKRPILSDLRESGSIEQDADLVMFVYRDEYYNPEETDSAGIAEVILAKHRNGATGPKLAFQKRHAVADRRGYDRPPPSGSSSAKTFRACELASSRTRVGVRTRCRARAFAPSRRMVPAAACHAGHRASARRTTTTAVHHDERQL
jgi:hypothetical protein